MIHWTRSSWARSLAASLTLASSLCADVCVENPAGGPTVCVGWQAPLEPVPALNFNIDYQANPAAPDVELITGAQWRVYARDASDPSQPGDMGAITATQPQDYVVSFARPDGSPGAKNVESVYLWPAGSHYSRILDGSHISGDLVGDLRVKPLNNVFYGSIEGLTVNGNVDGNISARSIQRLTIDGTYQGGIIRCTDVYGHAFA